MWLVPTLKWYGKYLTRNFFPFQTTLFLRKIGRATEYSGDINQQSLSYFDQTLVINGKPQRSSGFRWTRVINLHTVKPVVGFSYVDKGLTPLDSNTKKWLDDVYSDHLEKDVDYVAYAFV